MPFVSVLIGIIAALLFYSSTTAGYKKAGAGQTYRMESSTDVKLSRRLDNRSGTRSRVDHGFYSSSVSPSGRAEAYRMPQSIKHTIEEAQGQQSAAVPRPGNVSAKPGAAARPKTGPVSNRPSGFRGGK